eukprot:CAMPEP_0181039906 /NCGR_PEP_ID=MMETSP1070-20121207/10747_1 /TAXON_ID=265543 /ORGANISM="Minutocellus polymorphus, Strain NH13" /LENGTH=120 /DNA_ID=CAMNT_0023117845 /DNA_START=144 /DNA_END=506 /DNA_ORIENTATION=+
MTLGRKPGHKDTFFIPRRINAFNIVTGNGIQGAKGHILPPLWSSQCSGDGRNTCRVGDGISREEVASKSDSRSNRLEMQSKAISNAESALLGCRYEVICLGSGSNTANKPSFPPPQPRPS